MGEEEGEQVELHAGQLDLVAADRDRPAGVLEHEVADRDEILVLVRLRPAQHRTHARDELAGGEGFVT